jgi:hypothetical protein
MSKKNNSKKKAAHKRFAGCKQVTRTLDLLYYDGPLATATVVVDDDDGPLRLQLDYYASDAEMIDEEGYIGVRWTKKDLRHMLEILELSEELLTNERQQEDNDDRAGDSDEPSVQDQ